MFNFDFSVHAFWWTPLASSVWLIDNNGLTEKCQNWKYCENKDTYILDDLETWSWMILNDLETYQKLISNQKLISKLTIPLIISFSPTHDPSAVPSWTPISKNPCIKHSVLSSKQQKESHVGLVWNNTWVSKWWQNLHFRVICPIKHLHNIVCLFPDDLCIFLFSSLFQAC